MVKIVVGSMVLCHLLLPATPNQNQADPNTAPIVKVLGEVVDIEKGTRYVEKTDKKEAIKIETDQLIVKGKNKEGLYQIDSRACMLVRDETAKEREDRISPKIKVEPKQEELESEENVEDTIKPTPPPGLEIQEGPSVEDSTQMLPKLNEQEIKQVESLAPAPTPTPVPVETKQAESKAKTEKVPETKETKTNKSLLDYIR